MTKTENNNLLASLKSCLFGALAASAAGVAFTALFAFIMQKQWLGIGSVIYVNAGIKVVCAVIAAIIALRKIDRGALLYGALSGALYMLISFIVFSLISGSYSVGKGLFTDLLMCMLAGCITGMVRNLKR